MLPPILQRLQTLGHSVYENGDWNLNLFGVRSPTRTANAFDDLIGCAYKEQGLWRVEWWEATTDPGTYYLIDKPLNKSGTAVLKAGQYKGAYKLGLHRGYEALCQLGQEVSVYRDNTRDATLDLDESTLQTGYFGVNIHKRTGTDDTVDAASAGCQVFRYDKAFYRLLDLAHMQVKKRGWDTFTYTLIDDWRLPDE